MSDANIKLRNRDLSWLSFNHRVLQEAADARNPLYERIKFLAIFSSNLDEFFRVRVSALRAMLDLKKKAVKKLDFDPEAVLDRIHKVVNRQQEEFGEIFRGLIARELRKHRISLLRENQLKKDEAAAALQYFHDTVAGLLQPVFLSEDREPPFLENRALYLSIRLQKKPQPDAASEPAEPPQHVLLEIPSDRLPRFTLFPGNGGFPWVMFLDDIIRLGLPDFFPQHDVKAAFAVKMTRDAELYVDDEFSGDLVEKIRKALGKRKEGSPRRFLYDGAMPKPMLKLLSGIFGLEKESLSAGGRYHNFHDLFSFPNPDPAGMNYASMMPIEKSVNGRDGSPFAAIRSRDTLLYYPYHSYDPVIGFLKHAAGDPDVSAVDITLYRVARDSKVVEQLVRAAEAGKSVTAFVEVKARFDEESNLRWAEEMQKAGAKVHYSFPGLKVHAKLCLVTRRENEIPRAYAYLSTGNFNEQAARIYTDFGLFTADERITSEVQRLFSILNRNKEKGSFEHLLVAPYTMRDRLEELIDNEIANAKGGREAGIVAKMNSLEDPDMIERLYEASEKGVKVSLIVRGICSLIPGVKGMSRNIEVVSIVDRFLEHPRVWIFRNGGDEKYYLSSADWMKRNLSHRIEVAFPVFDEALKRQVKGIVELQLRDTVKARTVTKDQQNRYRKGSPEVHSQMAIYDYLRDSG